MLIFSNRFARLIPFFLAVLALGTAAFATDYSSTSFTVKDPVLDAGSATSTATNFGLGQSLSQTAIGKSTSESFQVWSGFQYYFKTNANTLTATAGNGQVSLSWTAPTTYLGVAVGSYEVGTGTVSGSYTFENVGAVTSYTKTGLSNGTTYYFKVKAKTANGTFLVFSNEASATPTAPADGGGGGGGSGGGGSPTMQATGASITFKGLASPGATVVVLRDGVIAARTTADAQANFTVTLSGLSSGVYSFGFYAEDTQGIRTYTLSYVQTMADGIAWTVDGIFLSPSMGVSHSLIRQGETIQLFGITVPGAMVNVTINSFQQFIEKVTALDTGAWFKDFNTGVLEIGPHSSRSQAQQEELVSPLSAAVEFHVGDRSVRAPTGGSTLVGELNGDGRINIVDFSILLFFWDQTKPANQKADINTSGEVDLVDFSILLYHWTG